MKGVIISALRKLHGSKTRKDKKYNLTLKTTWKDIFYIQVLKLLRTTFALVQASASLNLVALADYLGNTDFMYAT